MRRDCEYYKLRELFDQILGVFGKESRVSKSTPPFNAVLEDGRGVDLFELFWVVRERGGCGLVAKLAQWGFVAEEIGLSSGVGVALAVEAFYVKHLGLLDQWIQSFGREVGDKDVNLELLPVGLERQLRELLLDISDKSRVSEDEEHGKLGVEENDERVSTSTDLQSTVDMTKLSSVQKCVGEEGGDVAILDRSVGESFTRKRKRENFSGMLNWLTETAKNPSNVAFENRPEAYKQKEYEGKEFMTLVLVAREALLQSRRDKLGLEENDGRVITSASLQNSPEVTLVVELSNVEKLVDKDENSVIFEESVGGEEVFSRNRKRETFSGVLNWLIETAKNPSNVAFGNLTAAYKQKEYKGKELMTLVLIAREALLQSRRDELGLEDNDGRITTSTSLQNMLEVTSVTKLNSVEKLVDKDEHFLIFNKSVGGEEVFSRKRKRETFSGMLNWLTETAKNPNNSAFQNIGEAYKQKEYKGEQIPSLALLARDALLQKRIIHSIGKSDNSPSQKKHKMHPSMYEDHFSTTRLRFSPRIISQINVQLDPYHELSESEENDPFDDGHFRKPVPVGPRSQAELPQWTGMALDSDPKWLGTLHWPLKTNEPNLHAKGVPIGKGRQDSCHCRDPGSIECVKVHISDEKERLKSELGMVFYIWRFHCMGEGVSQSWTKAEEKKFNSTVRLNPPSLNKFFWNKLRTYFRTKSWKCLVSYYFNVFVLRRRTYQNRLTPSNIDSDDDESEVGSL